MLIWTAHTTWATSTGHSSVAVRPLGNATVTDRVEQRVAQGSDIGREVALGDGGPRVGRGPEDAVGARYPDLPVAVGAGEVEGQGVGHPGRLSRKDSVTGPAGMIACRWAMIST